MYYHKNVAPRKNSSLVPSPCLLDRCWILVLQEVPRITTMGPVLGGLWEGDSTTTFRERVRAEEKVDACFDWLDAQPESSVVYVCFGSIAMPSEAQVRELAEGLEGSGQRFFWVLRTSEALAEVLPGGFLERTKGRGLVYTEWAPQLHILAHRAVGGFLSHCGWNSVTEGMVMGVPMIAMPVMGDQMVNATLIVKVLGIGVRLNEIGAWFETVGSEAIETAVRVLMTGAAGEEMRRKVAQVSETIQRSVRPGGSSHENLTQFLRHLKSLKQ
jgi:UDP:flavonoid glycosyltransferase YjiC (YdhE family)